MQFHIQKAEVLYNEEIKKKSLKTTSWISLGNFSELNIYIKELSQ